MNLERISRVFLCGVLLMMVGGAASRTTAYADGAAVPQNVPAKPQVKRVAWFLGTFDPIHLNHMAATKLALRSGYDEVVLLPIPPRGQKDPLSVVQRVAMLKLAIFGESQVRVATWREISTVWTKGERTLMRQERQKHPHSQIARIIGADNIQTPDRIDYYSPEIPDVSEFLVMARAGYSLGMELPSWTRVVETHQTREISSTAVRAAAAQSKRLVGTSRPVAAYIKERNLYKRPSLQPRNRQRSTGRR